MTRLRQAAAGAGALGLVALVIALASSREAAPARCAEGLVALGARCCGEGQRLEGDRCAGAPRRCARGMSATPEGCVATPARVLLEGGVLHLGPGDWEAQGVVSPRDARIEAFVLDALEVTEVRYAACVAAEACASILPLTSEPGRAVSGIRRDEAARFCAWAGGALPSGDQLAFASAGAASRRYPWGDTGAVCRRAAWGLADGPCGRGGLGPELAGSHPDGASPNGILDLAGNVAEWTSTAGNPAGPTAEVRGGSWADGEAAALRSWYRREIASETRSAEIGFRCAYAPGEPEGGAPAP